MKTISLIEAVKIQQKIYIEKFAEYENLSDFEISVCLKSMTGSDFARMAGCMATVRGR